MTLPDRTRIPVGEGRGEVAERGSRFLARAGPAPSRERALAIRDAERERHPEATHHLYAVRLLDGDVRYDEDGEPSGTGGRPMLGALEAAGVRNAAVVVTRWFGGTKLGTGPLGRCYGEAARRALADAPLRLAVPGRSLSVSFRYEDTGAVSGILRASDCIRRDARYGERTELELGVPLAEWEELLGRLRDATSGRVRFRAGEGIEAVPDPG